MTNINDLWYAARQTQIIYMPHKLLETFGETSVQYQLLTRLSNEMNRLRTGVVKAARPRIVTPHYLFRQALDNFGPDARKYYEDMLSRKKGTPIIHYGLTFSKEDHNEEDIGGPLGDCASQMAKDAQDNLSETRGVIIGVEQHWEIALLFFLQTLVSESSHINSREMAQNGLLNFRNGTPVAVLNEIENDFANATTLEAAKNLGAKLRDFGLFDDFEERFFTLYSKFA